MASLVTCTVSQIRSCCLPDDYVRSCVLKSGDCPYVLWNVACCTLPALPSAFVTIHALMITSLLVDQLRHAKVNLEQDQVNFCLHGHWVRTSSDLGASPRQQWSCHNLVDHISYKGWDHTGLQCSHVCTYKLYIG